MPRRDRVADAADELYGVAPDDFVRRRTALAAAARADGAADAARRIARLGKPSRAAWTVNQLVRAEPDAADQLGELAASLLEAQASLDGEQLRSLSAQRGRLVDELVRHAVAASADDAPSGALRAEVHDSLAAALVDPAVLDAVRSGTLLRAVRASGFGPSSGADLAAVPAAANRPARGGKARTRRPEPPRAAPGRSPKAKPRADETRAQKRADRYRAERERAEQERAEQERAEQKRAERAAAVAAARGRLEEATAAQARQRDRIRILDEQLADARRTLGDHELEVRHSQREFERVERVEREFGAR